MKNDIGNTFIEVKASLEKREYKVAYKTLESEKLSNHPKASAIKSFLNYCEYVDYIPKDKALGLLRNLSQNNSDHATYLLANAYLLPGVYESLLVATPHAFLLAEQLYYKKYALGAILYADLFRTKKQYDTAWNILEEAKTFEKVDSTAIYIKQIAIINESQSHLDYLPKLFELCNEKYKNGHIEIYSVYAQLLLNKNSELFNPGLGLQVMEEGIMENNDACNLLKASLLASFEWYIKRDVKQAVIMLRKLINRDKHNQAASVLLSKIYIDEKEYQSIEYGNEVVLLLSGNIWYGNLQNLNLLLETVKYYQLFDSEYFLDAAKMKAKLEGKYSKSKFQIFGLLMKVVKPISTIYSGFMLIVSYITAILLSTTRFLIFYVPSLIRLFLK